MNENQEKNKSNIGHMPKRFRQKGPPGNQEKKPGERKKHR